MQTEPHAEKTLGCGPDNGIPCAGEGRDEKREPKKTGGLAEKFKTARERALFEKAKDRTSEFKENAKDAGHDIGRERGKNPKPSGWKPKHGPNR